MNQGVAMIRSVDHIITESEFQKNIRKYLRRDPAELGPIGVRSGKQMIGVYLSADEFNSLYAAAIRGLLRSRAKGKTVTQAEAQDRVQRRLQANRNKS